MEPYIQIRKKAFFRTLTKMHQKQLLLMRLLQGMIDKEESKGLKCTFNWSIKLIIDSF